MRSAAKIKSSKNLNAQVKQLTAIVEQLLARIEILQQPVVTPMETKEKLTELNRLTEFIGYEDLRSIKAWLKKKNITVIVMGRKNYIRSESLDGLIESQISPGTHSSVITNGAAPSGSERKLVMRKRTRSKAATDFLSNIKS